MDHALKATAAGLCSMFFGLPGSMIRKYFAVDGLMPETGETLEVASQNCSTLRDGQTFKGSVIVSRVITLRPASPRPATLAREFVSILSRNVFTNCSEAAFPLQVLRSTELSLGFTSSLVPSASFIY